MSSWQDLLAWGLVAVAAAIVLRRCWRLVTGQRTGCGGCGRNCSAPRKIDIAGGVLPNGKPRVK